MEALNIKGSEDTPEIKLDKTLGVFLIAGNSFCDDPFAVFTPVFKWLEGYARNPNPTTHMDIRLNYINTPSSKQITDILFMLEKIKDQTEIVVHWYYDSMDEDMEFEGEAIQSMVAIPVELIAQ